jgi:hypothetical protein
VAADKAAPKESRSAAQGTNEHLLTPLMFAHSPGYAGRREIEIPEGCMSEFGDW